MLLKAQEIEWAQDRPLTWNDFKGKPDYRSPNAAVTYWDITYTYKCEVRDSIYVMTYNIKNIFLPQSSWVKRDDMSDYILSHEQLHFDICELFARKLAAAFHDAVFTSNYKIEIGEIYGKIRRECDIMQSKYDGDSQNSRNSNMQLRWQLYIYLELKNLPRNY